MMDSKVFLNSYYKSIFTSLSFVFIFSDCSFLRPARDSWNEKYIHFSGKYELVFQHFSEKSVVINIFEIPYSDKSRPRRRYFAEIKADKIVYQALREPDCRVEFRRVDAGILLDDFCHGTGEDEGLYRHAK